MRLSVLSIVLAALLVGVPVASSARQDQTTTSTKKAKKTKKTKTSTTAPSTSAPGL